MLPIFSKMKKNSAEQGDSKLPVETIIQRTTHNINMIKENRYKTEVVPDGTHVSMEVDTGSRVTLLNKRDFQKISDVESLQPAKLILRGYTGNQITCLGEKSMKVEINGEVKEVIVRVVDGDGPSLLGRDLISKFTLPWENILNVACTKLEGILENYPGLFDTSSIGKIKDLQVQLHVDDTRPIFKKASPVPYAIREKYETTDTLEEQGIIKKVEYSEWASPVVPIMKPNGD